MGGEAREIEGRVEGGANIMISLILASITLLVMIIASIAAYKKVPKDAQFPMQTGLNGEVSWRAPKIIAVSFFPALTVLIFALFFVILPPNSTAISPLILPTLIGTNAVILLGIHSGFLYFGVHDVRKAAEITEYGKIEE